MWDASFRQLASPRDQSLEYHQSVEMGESGKREQRLKEDAILNAEENFPSISKPSGSLGQKPRQ